MDYIDIINSEYFKQTYSKIEELKKDYSVNHGFIHITNVIENAKNIATTFNLDDRQKNLLLIAAALHDIGYLNGKDNHAYNGSIIAKDILKKWKFANEDIVIISNAIKNHGGKNDYEYIDIISACLIIADKIDFINTRYDKNKLEESKIKIFPNITKTYVDYINNEIILNIAINNEFSISLFENSNYYKKLINFLNLLSKRFNASFKIKYIHI